MMNEEDILSFNLHNMANLLKGHTHLNMCDLLVTPDTKEFIFMSKYQITDDEIFVEHPQKTFVLTFYTRNSYINYLFRKLLEFSDGV